MLVVCIGLVAFFFAINYFIMNWQTLRRRNGSAHDTGKQVSSAKQRGRLITLLIAEFLVLIISFFSLSYMVSLNGTLALKGDAQVMQENTKAKKSLHLDPDFVPAYSMLDLLHIAVNTSVFRVGPSIRTPAVTRCSFITAIGI